MHSSPRLWGASKVCRVRGETAQHSPYQRQTASCFGVCSGSSEIYGRKGRTDMLPKEGREQWGRSRDPQEMLQQCDKKLKVSRSDAVTATTEELWQWRQQQESGIYGGNGRQHSKEKHKAVSIRVHPTWLRIIILLDRLFYFWEKTFPSRYIMYFRTSLKFNVYSFWISKIIILTPITINI